MEGQCPVRDVSSSYNASSTTNNSPCKADVITSKRAPDAPHADVLSVRLGFVFHNPVVEEVVHQLLVLGLVAFKQTLHCAKKNEHRARGATVKMTSTCCMCIVVTRRHASSSGMP
eukprot:6890466-Pyramimonas_sp.AAC.1